MIAGQGDHVQLVGGAGTLLHWNWALSFPGADWQKMFLQ
jgi:hypothetical protein